MPHAHPPTERAVDVRAPRSAAWVTSAVATGPVSVAALRGAATGSCRGCEPDPTVRRARPARTA